MRKTVVTKRRKPASAKAATPTPARPAFSYRLNSIGGCRRELAKLYLAARQGQLAVADVSKLANVVYLIAQLIQGCELEARVSAIERSRTDEGGRP